ncbi:MAG: hypothetical protein SWO11_01060 [Thermodesulfobacteriota bacterium]|nr:hypothetical protein [Thermodesulfobacteriota bacterium]
MIERINHPHLITIYPLAAQFVFAIGAALGSGMLELKILLVIMDMATCTMIVWMISIVGLPPSMQPSMHGIPCQSSKLQLRVILTESASSFSFSL